jgi:hypothetical protein
VFTEEEDNDYKISTLEVQRWLVYKRVFSYFPYKSKLLNKPPTATWEENGNCNVCRNVG